jgi:7-carboxy-7-deazaguanine synthase
MKELRLSEHYASVQGEGPRVGIPTQFVRFAGCNMRCPLWPCDTQHAIEPSIYRTQSEMVSAAVLHRRIDQMRTDTGASNICFTGGEPFMQASETLQELFGLLINLHDDKPFQLEVFTNGSFPFNAVAGWRALQYTMDWKLSGSGEAETKLDMRTHNAYLLDDHDGIKFVVKTQDDLWEAISVMMKLQAHHGFKAKFWVGRAWDSEITDQQLIQFILEHGLPWRLNMQVHKWIWDPEERAV